MKITISQLFVVAFLILFQGSPDPFVQTIWSIAYYFAATMMCLGLIVFGLVLAFIRRPEVQRRIHGDRMKMTQSGRIFKLLKGVGIAAAFIFLLNMPWMAVGQMTIVALVFLIQSSLFDRRNGY